MNDVSLTKVCPVCREDYLTVFEVRIFRSSVCGHPICTKCLINHGNAKLNLSKTSQWTDQEQVIKCLVCGVPSKALQWEDTANEENLLERESMIRTRVMSILNCDRKSYENTPAYNEFLEQREEIIYDLVFSEDDDLKAQRQNFLKSYEVEHQQKILEASERQRLRERNWIREIVEKEDVFYEIVNSGFHGMGGNLRFTNAAAAAAHKKKYIHKLQQQHPQYFDQEAASSALGGGAAGPLNASQSEVSVTKLIELHANLPNTIIPNIDYFKLKRKPNDDRAALLRAGGHKKDRIATRTRQEMFAAFRL